MPVKVLSRGLCLPDVAAGDNEIEQHRNFSETHFPGVAPCRFRLVVQFTASSGRYSVLKRPFSEANGRPFFS